MCKNFKNTTSRHMLLFISLLPLDTVTSTVLIGGEQSWQGVPMPVYRRRESWSWERERTKRPGRIFVTG